MPKTIKAALLGLSALLVIFVIGGGLGVRAANNEGAYRQLGVYSEVLSRVRTEYVEEPNVSQVTDGALHGLLEALDANSSYLNPTEYKQFKDHKSDGKAAIGAAISKRFGYGAVISVLPNGPAAKAGVESGDIIEAVDGRSTREMSLAELRSLLNGQQGSNVALTLVRARKAEPVKVTVTRDAVVIPPISDKMLEDGIGYIKADSLMKGKAQEIAQDIKRLQHSGAKKLILDLRNSAEGEEQEGVAVANLFLNHGTIGYVQGQKYPKETFTADASKAVTTLPLVVLVNRGTAGPAEIVASAILDNARGDVVGDKTFGVGSIQKVIEIPDGSALILSVAKYYTPAGKAIQDSAVTPNILIADKDDDAALPDDEDSTPQQQAPKGPQEDEQLRRAVEVLKQQKA
ncbi:MAG: S41 family peptidase [Acidobacteriota bacterium]|nr:S41 family peptidase [Acidobacteriota bacterium]